MFITFVAICLLVLLGRGIEMAIENKEQQNEDHRKEMREKMIARMEKENQAPPAKRYLIGLASFLTIFIIIGGRFEVDRLLLFQIAFALFVGLAVQVLKHRSNKKIVERMKSEPDVSYGQIVMPPGSGKRIWGAVVFFCIVMGTVVYFFGLPQ